MAVKIVFLKVYIDRADGNPPTSIDFLPTFVFKRRNVAQSLIRRRLPRPLNGAHSAEHLNCQSTHFSVHAQ